MKKLRWAIAGIILVIAVACGIDVRNEAQTIKWQADHIPELRRILPFAENKGADWATDELLINNVDSFKKQSLYKKWGEPTARTESATKDIWVLSDHFRIIADYNDSEQIEQIKVVSDS